MENNVANNRLDKSTWLLQHKRLMDQLYWRECHKDWFLGSQNGSDIYVKFHWFILHHNKNKENLVFTFGKGLKGGMGMVNWRTKVDFSKTSCLLLWFSFLKIWICWTFLLWIIHFLLWKYFFDGIWSMILVLGILWSERRTCMRGNETHPEPLPLVTVYRINWYSLDVGGQNP